MKHALDFTRASLGATLLVRPEPVLDRLGGRPADAVSRRYARVLGARHLLEAVATREGSPKALALGALVDAIHATSALALAWRSHHRRLAAFNAVGATGFAIAGWRRARVG